MTPKLRNVEYIDRYRLAVTFVDGHSGPVDLEPELWGEVFEPLKDISEFQKFTVDLALNTITWPTGADLAPEFLYEQVTAHQSNEGC